MKMWKEMRRSKKKKTGEVKGGRDLDGAATGLVMLFKYYLLL